MKSNELRAAREAANLSQIELAELAGVSRSSVAFSERGLELGDETASKITRALAAAIEDNSRKVARAKRQVNKAVAPLAVESTTAA